MRCEPAIKRAMAFFDGQNLFYAAMQAGVLRSCGVLAAVCIDSLIFCDEDVAATKRALLDFCETTRKLRADLGGEKTLDKKNTTY